MSAQADSKDLDGKVVVVTGGASGIGAATAGRLSRDGAAVHVLDLAAPAVDAQAWTRVDVGDRQGVERAFDGVLASYGRLDLLVTAAGIVRDSAIAEFTVSDWEDVMRVNLRGTLNCTEAAASRIAAGGRIVHIGSRSALSDSHRANYVASKVGIASLTRSYALRLASSRTTVNYIGPGLIATPMIADAPAESLDAVAKATPIQRLGQAADIAAAVGFLCSSDAGFITGQILYVCGGRSLLPFFGVGESGELRSIRPAFELHT